MIEKIATIAPHPIVQVCWVVDDMEAAARHEKRGGWWRSAPFAHSRQRFASSHAGTGRPLLRKNSGFQSFE